MTSIGSFVTRESVRSCSLISDEINVCACTILIKKYVIGIGPDGSKYFDILLQNYVRDITFIPSFNSVAVSCSISETRNSETQIIIYNIYKKKTVKFISVQGDYDGHTFKEENVIYLIGNLEIGKLNIFNERFKRVCDQMILGDHKIATYNNRLYYTTNKYLSSWLDSKEGNVMCCDLHGGMKRDFEIREVLDDPGSIAIDNEGYVYIAGISSNKLLSFSRTALNTNNF